MSTSWKPCPDNVLDPQTRLLICMLHKMHPAHPLLIKTERTDCKSVACPSTKRTKIRRKKSLSPDFLVRIGHESAQPLPAQLGTVQFALFTTGSVLSASPPSIWSTTETVSAPAVVSHNSLTRRTPTHRFACLLVSLLAARISLHVLLARFHLHCSLRSQTAVIKPTNNRTQVV